MVQSEIFGLIPYAVIPHAGLDSHVDSAPTPRFCFPKDVYSNENASIGGSNRKVRPIADICAKFLHRLAPWRKKARLLT